MARTRGILNNCNRIEIILTAENLQLQKKYEIEETVDLKFVLL